MKQLGEVKNTKVVKLDKDDCFSEDRGSEQNSQHLSFFENTQVLRCIKVFLDEDIKAPKYYRTLVQAAESLGEGDILHISINSYGGQLDGALAIIGAMQNSDCHVQVSIDGAAASAASLIALASPNLLISEYASMMIHAASFASFGKQSDVISHASFVDKRTKSIMQSIYKDFLTDSELQEVIMGREIWMDADEIVERLEMRKEIQEKRMLEEEEQQEKRQAELEGKRKQKQQKAKDTSSSESVVDADKTDAKKVKVPSAKPQAKKPQAKPKKAS